MAGLFIGGMLPFVFSALAMGAVGRAAMAMIEEVRRQFKDIPALKAALKVMRKYDSDMSKASVEDRKIFNAADGVAEYDKCVAISTKASIREMVLPGVLAIFMPVIVGFLGGAEMLGGLLAGVTVTGVMMAIFQSNTGSAWDNAKKMVEEGIEIGGVTYKKGSEPHKATVVGDTVGDPFKDTSGPSLNILIKLMSVVALIIASSLPQPEAPAKTAGMNISATIHQMHKTDATKKVQVKMTKQDDGTFKAVITTLVTKDGKITTNKKVFTGTEAEVKAQVKKLQSTKIVMTKSCCKGSAGVICKSKKVKAKKA